MTDKMRSFLKGLALGLAGKPLEFAKEPVAYLYNGVRLPKLPEWDKAKYPYAVLAYGTGESVPYWVYFCEKQPYINSDDEIVINEKTGGTLVSPTGTSAIYYRYYNLEDTVGWEDNSTPASLLSPITLEKTNVFWCSADILNTDGTVFLAASEPVPVYE